MATMTDAKARFEALRRKAAAGPSVHKSSSGNGLVRPRPLSNASVTPFGSRTAEEKSKKDLSGSASDHGPTKDVPKSSLLSQSEHMGRVTETDPMENKASLKSSGRAAFLHNSPFHRMESKKKLESGDKPPNERNDNKELLVHNQRPSFAKRLPFHQMEAKTIATIQKAPDEDSESNDDGGCYLPKKNKRSTLLRHSPFHRMESESSIQSESSFHSEGSQNAKTNVSSPKESVESSESTDSSCHSVNSKRSAFLQRSPFHRADSESSDGPDDSPQNKKNDATKLLMNNQHPSFAKRSTYHTMEQKSVSQTQKEDVGKSASDHGPSRRTTNLPTSSLLSNTVHTSRVKTSIREGKVGQNKSSPGNKNSAFDELKAKLKSRLERDPSEQSESKEPAQTETNEKNNPPTGAVCSIDPSPDEDANRPAKPYPSKIRSPFLNNSPFHKTESKSGPSPEIQLTSLEKLELKPGNVGIVSDTTIPPKGVGKSPLQRKTLGSAATSSIQTEIPSWMQRRDENTNGKSIDSNHSEAGKPKTQPPLKNQTQHSTAAMTNPEEFVPSRQEYFTEQSLSDNACGKDEVAKPLEEVTDAANDETEIEEVTEFEEEELVELEEEEIVEEEEITEFEEEEITEISYEEECVMEEESKIEIAEPVSACLESGTKATIDKTSDGSKIQEAVRSRQLPASTQSSSVPLRLSTNGSVPLTPITCHGSSPSRELARHKSGPESFQERSTSFHSPRQSPRSPIRQKSGPNSFDGLPAAPMAPAAPAIQVSRKIRQVTKTLEFSSMISKDDTVKLFIELHDLVKGNDTKQREFGVGKGIARFVAVLKKHQDDAAVLESGFPVIAELANIETNRDALALHGCIEFVLIAMLANEEGLVIQERGCNAIASLAKTPKYQEWIVASNGIEVIITIQSAFKSNVKIQTACLRAMHNLARDNRENTFNITAKGGVRSLMEIVKLPEHSKVLEFQMEACATMATLARTNDSNRGSIAKAGGLDVTLKAIKTFPRDEDLLAVAFDTLFCLATEHSQNTDTIVANRGVETLVQSMKIYESNLRLQESSIRLARLLTEGEATTKKFVSAGGMKVVMALMRHFEESHTIQDEGCSTLLNMARQPENKETICGAGGIGIIVMAMKKLRDNAFVQKNGCKALECLATNDQNKKSIAAGGGVSAILTAMKKHGGAPALQGLAVSALKKLATIARNRNTMNSANCIETVERVMKSYPTNTFLHSNGKALILLLDPLRANDDD
eukprot:scaffold8374_cov175-Amphora_coffeaeformis.AAC.66